LSENSINFAKEFENDTLHFKVKDMREPFDEKFDAVFNLFTSFGYFETENNNLETLKAIIERLSEYGFAVLDFMNVHKVIEHLIAEETKEVDGIVFNIKRWTENGYIFKNICFEHENESYDFTERDAFGKIIAFIFMFKTNVFKNISVFCPPLNVKNNSVYFFGFFCYQMFNNLVHIHKIKYSKTIFR